MERAVRKWILGCQVPEEACHQHQGEGMPSRVRKPWLYKPNFTTADSYQGQSPPQGADGRMSASSAIRQQPMVNLEIKLEALLSARPASEVLGKG